MKIELDRDTAQWVAAEVASGAFPTAEEVGRQAIIELRANALRATLDAAVAERGSRVTSDARRYAREYLEKRNPPAALP